MDTSLITPDDIRQSTLIQCRGGYPRHPVFHVWLKDNQLLCIYSRKEVCCGEDVFYSYRVSLNGKVLDVRFAGEKWKDESTILQQTAFEEYGKRRYSS